MTSDTHHKFFVSHAADDKQWAEWIAYHLINAGYAVELGAWEWTAGQDFVAAMQQALQRADHVVAIYSDAYFSHPYAQAEHRAAFTASVSGRAGSILPVRVDECGIPPLYANLVCIDLAGLDEASATRHLLDGVRRATGSPTQVGRPAFPAGVARWPAPHGAPASARPVRCPPVWNLPRRNPFFVGRASLLRLIQCLLHPPARGETGGADRHAGIVPLHGMGGIGKTQLVCEYAYRHADHYQLIWFVDADDRSLAETCLLELAAAMELPVAAPRGTVIRQLWSLLGQRTDWLLIYDNVDSPSDLTTIFPPDSGRVLVTSRNSAVAQLAPALIEVDEFARPESVLLLREHCPTVTVPDADRVAAALGDLPLAVEQAGCFLAETGLHPADYLQVLADQPTSAGLSDPTIDRHPGLAAVVAVSRQRLLRADPAAAATLDQMALLAAEPLPLTPRDTHQGPNRYGVRVAEATGTAAFVRQLSRLGLARRAGTSIHIHRLVQALLRSAQSAEVRADSLRGAQRLLTTADLADLDVSDSTTWPAYATLEPHVQALADHVDQATRNADRALETESAPFRALLVRTSSYLFVSAQYQRGHHLAQRAHHRWQQSLGPDHPDTLAAADVLGAILGDGFDEHVAAHDLLRDTLTRRRRVLGERHPDTLRSAWSLAYTMGELGDHTAARVHHQDTLVHQRESLGGDHRDTMLSAHSLGYLLTWTGEHATARDLLQDTLARRRRVLGHRHPDTLRTAAVLGIAVRGMGDHPSAHDLHQKVLEVAREELGNTHPVTLFTALHLALDLVAQGAPDLGRTTLVQALGWTGEGHDASFANPRWAARHRDEIQQVFNDVGAGRTRTNDGGTHS